jgi:hypothetical protein
MLSSMQTLDQLSESEALELRDAYELMTREDARSGVFDCDDSLAVMAWPPEEVEEIEDDGFDDDEDFEDDDGIGIAIDDDDFDELDELDDDDDELDDLDDDEDDEFFDEDDEDDDDDENRGDLRPKTTLKCPYCGIVFDRVFPLKVGNCCNQCGREVD